MRRNTLPVNIVRKFALGLSLLAVLGGGLAFHSAAKQDAPKTLSRSAPAMLIADDKGGKNSGVETHGLKPATPDVSFSMPVTIIADGVETHGKNDPPSGGKGRALA